MRSCPHGQVVGGTQEAACSAPCPRTRRGPAASSVQWRGRRDSSHRSARHTPGPTPTQTSLIHPLRLQGELVDEIHRTGVVSSAEFGAAGTEVRAHVPLALAQRLGPLRAATAGVVGVAAHVAAAEAAAAADASAADGSWGCDDEELERLLAAEEVPLR